MAATATIRELRNQFPKVRKLVEQEGEVVVTDQGKPTYRLTAYTPAHPTGAPVPKNYLERLRRHQPRSVSAATANALHEDNRGDR
jgi:antitoxin (DNA-binding transcriptional repressor) of toxin-antitoxin stability system